MDLMPDNILLSILQHLNRESLCLGARFVCSRWANLSYDQSLWKYVSIPKHFSDVRAFQSLQQIHEYVEDLDMGNCHSLTSEGIHKIAKLNLCNLRKITVPFDTVIEEDVYVELSKSSPRLVEIDNIHSTYSQELNPLFCQKLFPMLSVVNDRPVSTFGVLRPGGERQNPKLQRWTDSISELASVCQNVTTYHCTRGLEYMDSNGLELLSTNFPQLRSLELSSCLIDDEGLERFFKQNTSQCELREIMFDKPGKITDKGLATLANNCPELKNLKLARCGYITNKGAQYLIKKCPHITDLHLNTFPGYFEEEIDEQSKADQVDNQTLSEIGNTLTKLITLRILHSASVTCGGMCHVVSGCPWLNGLMIFQCPMIGDETLTHFLRLKFLRSVILVNCDKITPGAVLKFILSANTLQRLTFYTKSSEFRDDMNELAEEIFTQIDQESSQFRPNQVKKLALRGVGGGFLQLLTVLCPNLLTLDMRDSLYIREWSMISVLKNCELLEQLDISSMEDAGDKFLNALCTAAPCLRVLTLGTSVNRMSMAAVAEVARCCSSLRSIEMDIAGDAIDEHILVEEIKKSHGGYCCMYVEKDSELKDRYVELHFTPVKYLGSITRSSDDNLQ